MGIRRRTIGGLAALLAVGGGIGAVALDGSPATAASAARATPRPNVVLVLTDDLSKDLVRYMPHVRAMQRAGTSFSNYVVTDSLCCPSRSSLFTGEFPHDTGIFTNKGSDGGFHKFAAERLFESTYATDLHAGPRGYRTAFMGKFLNEYSVPADTGPQADSPRRGWSHWVANDNGYREFDYRFNVDGKPGPVHGHAPADYLTDQLASRAVGFVGRAAKAGQPFALELATFAPHAPSTPAPRDAAKFPGLKAPRSKAFNAAVQHPPRWLAGRARLGPKAIKLIDTRFRKRVRSVQAVDRALGLIQAELRRRGIARNTYVVFTSDNGFHLGQHRLRSGKQTAFDHDVNVPLVVTGPSVPRAHVERRIVENVDLRPTFAALAGRAVPATVDGHSFARLLGRGTRPKAWRTAALVEHHGQDFPSASDPDSQTAADGNPPTYEAIRLPHATYVEYANGDREYYDNARDPFQLDNAYRSLTAARKRQLHARLRALASCHRGSTCWRAGNPR